MLLDITAIDERSRTHREGQPPADFSVVYHLVSLDKNQDVRVKVALHGEHPSIRTSPTSGPTRTGTSARSGTCSGSRWKATRTCGASSCLPWWEGHPLRKEHPARATEMEPFHMSSEDAQRMLATLEFKPEEWGMKRESGDQQYMFLNIGPQHPATHGILRLVAQLDGEEIVDLVPEIGFHHRGAEKMGERQTWHTYIPYTDRIDYLGGLLNNFPYVLAVEKLAGIRIPERAQVIRVMMAELFRVISHLVYYGTFSARHRADVSRVLDVHGPRARLRHRGGGHGRPHASRVVPHRRRRAGPAEGLGHHGRGISSRYMRRRLKDYDGAVLKNRIFKARTVGIGPISAEEAIAWGASGPLLRATGVDWDLRKKRPYGGYERFDFDVTATHGDSYDRLVVHVEEMRQSLRIIEQCLKNMPGRALQVRPSPCHPAPQGADDARHRDAHHAFPRRELGPGDPSRRGVRGGGGLQGQPHVLPGERRRAP